MNIVTVNEAKRTLDILFIEKVFSDAEPITVHLCKSIADAQSGKVSKCQLGK